MSEREEIQAIVDELKEAKRARSHMDGPTAYAKEDRIALLIKQVNKAKKADEAELTAEDFGTTWAEIRFIRTVLPRY